MRQNSKDLGGISGSRERSQQAVSALTGFDPGRWINHYEPGGMRLCCRWWTGWGEMPCTRRRHIQETSW